MRFDNIIDYLCATAGPTIAGTGGTDQTVNKLQEAKMAMSFRRYICGLEGDNGNDYFKMDEDYMLYIFNGKYYEMIESLEYEVLGEIIFEVMFRTDVGPVYLANSVKKIKEFCINRLKADRKCHFEPDRRYVCFKNGVFDCETGKLNDFNVKYKTDIVLNFNYTAGLKSALWDKVLAQTVPDENMRETFHQFCGCFLAKRSEYKIEYICFVVGEGQNGKSIICKAVVNMLGPRVASSYSPEQLFKGGNQSDYRLADVNGNIVNYCDDVSKKDFSGGDFKSFVSGGEFTGRHPYSKKPTKVTKVPLMLCCANGMPPTTDDTDGYFRRFLIILAPNKVDERDKDVTLEKKLQADEVKAAIFNWMYEGYRSFVKNEGKVEVASSVKALVEEMKENSNSLRRWISQMGYWAAPDPQYPAAPGWKSLKEWIQEYIKYCQEFGETPRSRSAVTEQFKKMGCVSKRRSDGMWYYMEPGAVEKEEKEEISADLPPIGPSEENLPF